MAGDRLVLSLFSDVRTLSRSRRPPRASASRASDLPTRSVGTRGDPRERLVPLAGAVVGGAGLAWVFSLTFSSPLMFSLSVSLSESVLSWSAVAMRAEEGLAVVGVDEGTTAAAGAGAGSDGSGCWLRLGAADTVDCSSAVMSRSLGV